jgi:hypothetical protein
MFCLNTHTHTHTHTYSHHFLTWWNKSWRITNAAVSFGVMEKVSYMGIDCYWSFCVLVIGNRSTYIWIRVRRESCLWKFTVISKVGNKLFFCFFCFFVKYCDVKFQTCETQPNIKFVIYLCEIAWVIRNRYVYSIYPSDPILDTSQHFGCSVHLQIVSSN